MVDYFNDSERKGDIVLDDGGFHSNSGNKLSLDKKVEGICLARYATNGDFDLSSEEEKCDNNNWSTFNNPLMYRFLHEYLRIAEENNKPLTKEYWESPNESLILWV